MAHMEHASTRFLPFVGFMLRGKSWSADTRLGCVNQGHKSAQKPTSWGPTSQLTDINVVCHRTQLLTLISWSIATTFSRVVPTTSFRWRCGDEDRRPWLLVFTTMADYEDHKLGSLDGVFRSYISRSCSVEQVFVLQPTSAHIYRFNVWGCLGQSLTLSVSFSLSL